MWLNSRLAIICCAKTSEPHTRKRVVRIISLALAVVRESARSCIRFRGGLRRLRRLHVENLVQLSSCQALTIAHIRELGSIKQVDDILICDVISSGGWRGALRICEANCHLIALRISQVWLCLFQPLNIEGDCRIPQAVHAHSLHLLGHSHIGLQTPSQGDIPRSYPVTTFSDPQTGQGFALPKMGAINQMNSAANGAAIMPMKVIPQGVIHSTLLVALL